MATESTATCSMGHASFVLASPWNLERIEDNVDFYLMQNFRNILTSNPLLHLVRISFLATAEYRKQGT